jgi:hypothetical protein
MTKKELAALVLPYGIIALVGIAVAIFAFTH